MQFTFAFRVGCSAHLAVNNILPCEALRAARMVRRDGPYAARAVSYLPGVEFISLRQINNVW